MAPKWLGSSALFYMHVRNWSWIFVYAQLIEIKTLKGYVKWVKSKDSIQIYSSEAIKKHPVYCIVLWW